MKFRVLEKSIWVLEKSWKFVSEKGYKPCNKPFPRCFLPLFQKYSWCTTFIWSEFDLQDNECAWKNYFRMKGCAPRNRGNKNSEMLITITPHTLLDPSNSNRPFPSSLVPLFQSESKCETFLMKMTLICMKMKLHAELIFIWMVSHLDLFWNRGTRELGNGLFSYLNSNPFPLDLPFFVCFVFTVIFYRLCQFVILNSQLSWTDFFSLGHS